MKRTIIILLTVGLLGMGCAAASINQLSSTYKADSKAFRSFVKITAKDWDIGTGAILGAIPESELPAWVPEEIDKVSTWLRTKGANDDFELGYSFGLRFRLAGPVVRAAIQQYAPGLLTVREVIAVLAFFSL